MTLRDLMTKDVLTTSADTSVAGAAEAMTERRIGSACVVDEDGELKGIITERDVLRAAASGRDLTGEPVTGWMTPDPITTGPDEVPSEVATVMRERGFRHMPVIEDGELAGILSMRDLWGFVFLPSEPDDMTLR
ncbi:MAG: CBS domain-containing protein [Actinobacteria bacterium]|nr:CBS domain-containing protein [Actinomycetota bacterium]